MDGGGTLAPHPPMDDDGSGLLSMGWGAKLPDAVALDACDGLQHLDFKAVGRPRWSLAAAGRDHALPPLVRAVRSQRGRLRRRKMIHPAARHMRLPTALATGDPWGGGSGGGPQRRARTRIPRRPHHQRPCHPPPSPWPVAPQGQAMSGCSSKTLIYQQGPAQKEDQLSYLCLRVHYF
ncbi:hypothetical protein VPH35_112066 [Triticum aestivum]